MPKSRAASPASAPAAPMTPSRPSANKPVTGLHLSVPRDRLSEMQGIIKAITGPASTSNPLLNMVYVEATTDGVLRIVATDTEQSFETTVDAVVERPGKCLIHGDKFVLVASVMPDGAIELRECGPRVDVIGGEMTLGLVTMPVEDYPLPSTMHVDEPNQAPMRRIKMQAGALAEALAFTVPLVCPDDNRYGINGLHLEWSDDGALRMVATDGHRLSYAELEVLHCSHPKDPPISARSLLPRKALAHIMGLLVKLNSAMEVELCMDTNAAELRIERSVYRFRLIDGEFPDYRRVIPSSKRYEVELELTRVAAMIKRVNAMRLASGRPVTLTFATRDEILEASGQDDNKNSVEDRVSLRVKATCADPTLKIGFNAKYLGEVLGLFHEALITMKLGDPLSPMVMCDSNPRRLMVVMPMRLE